MAVSPGRLLIADDQADVLAALRLVFKGEGFETETVSSPAAVLAALQRRDCDLLLMDLNYTRDTTSGQEGLELLDRLQALDHPPAVVVMTAWGSVDLAVEAMRRGARDFVQKPWENARLLAIVHNQIALQRSQRQSERLQAENELLRGGGPVLIAESPAMKPVLDLIARVGPSDANVLITGENGTGKGVVAKAIHAVSTRRAKSLVTVNMGGITEALFESELFGHVRGAFTDAKSDRVGRIELAEGGSLFLDEIANLPLGQQAKLLRVLETGEFERVGSSKTQQADVRFISATNADPHQEVATGKFRQDLLFRLNTIEIHLPPLRERPEDIPLLAAHCLREQVRRYRKEIEGFEDSALQALRKYPWPGNVRELEHAVERGVLMCRGSHLQAGDLGLRSGTREAEPRLEDLGLEDVEKLMIRKALARFDGSALKAAEALGLSRSAFYRRLEKYGL
ncbi:MAG: sigma-54-dependent Fis family transcriptional regulator [Verrucomicrobiales bacterium]|nr:sigma-54-dependent Fis family transcriptional regulator [Verrucomicrobiales bacterium]